jgi:hypothetical protein
MKRYCSGIRAGFERLLLGDARRGGFDERYIWLICHVPIRLMWKA